MRAFQPRGKCSYGFHHRPFDGLGAALYAAAGDGSIEATAIRYRRRLCPDGGLFNVPGPTIPFGGESFSKASQAVAIVKSPDTFEGIDVNALGWADQTVWMQVRTHECDVENEQLAGRRKFVFDSNGDLVAPILGTARLLRSEKRVAGGWRFVFLYLPSPDGGQPDEFALIATAGPTTPDEVVAPYVRGIVETTLEVAGLDDAGAYTFKIVARNDDESADLLTGLDITADASGPPAVTGLTAIPR